MVGQINNVVGSEYINLERNKKFMSKELNREVEINNNIKDLQEIEFKKNKDLSTEEVYLYFSERKKTPKFTPLATLHEDKILIIEEKRSTTKHTNKKHKKVSKTLPGDKKKKTPYK